MRWHERFVRTSVTAALVLIMVTVPGFWTMAGSAVVAPDPGPAMGPVLPSGPAMGPVLPSGPAMGPVLPSGPAMGPVLPSGPAMGPVLPSGPAMGPVLPTGSAMGPVLPTGPAMGPVLPTGPAMGPVLPSGPAMGPVLPSGPAMGPVLPTGSAMGPVLPTGPAMGPVLPTGPAMGPVLPSGPAMGPVLPSGPAMGPVLPTGPAMGPVLPQDSAMGPLFPIGPSMGPVLLIGSATGPVLPAQEGTAGKMLISLDRAVELGLANNETLKQAGERVLGAEATVREAKSGRNPTVDLMTRYGRNILKPVMFLPSDMGEAFGGVTKIEIGEDNDASAIANLRWNAWTGGRVSSAIGLSEAIADAVRSGEIAVADYVRFIIQDSYYIVLLADATLKINEAAYETTLETVRIARAGHTSGTVSRFDLLRAEVELDNRETPMIVARNDLDQALFTLKRRCGLDPHVEISLSDSLGYVDQPEELDHLLEKLEKTNPEIIAVEHQVMAAEMNIKLEKAARWPGLQIGANYLLQGQWSDSANLDTDKLAHSSAITAAFVWPIFDGLKAKARIDRAQADKRTAEVELTRVSKDKELAVRVSRLTLVNAITALQGRSEAVVLAEEAYRLAEVRLLNGLATPLERLDAELAMTTARGQFARALYAANIAEAALELTIGGNTAGTYGTAAGKETNDE